MTDGGENEGAGWPPPSEWTRRRGDGLYGKRVGGAQLTSSAFRSQSPLIRVMELTGIEKPRLDFRFIIKTPPR
jgi:hypothetical protein